MEKLAAVFKTQSAASMLKRIAEPSFSVQEKISRLATTATLADVQFIFPDVETRQSIMKDNGDVEIKTTVTKVPPVYAHRCIIRLGSPILSSLVDMYESLQPGAAMLEIPVGQSGISHDGMREVLRYLYGDVLTYLRADLLEATLKVALTFQISALVERCMSEIAANLSPSNFIQWYHNLKAIGLPHTCIIAYLTADFAAATAKLDSLRQIPRPLLEEVLASDDLEMPEKALFELLLMRASADARAHDQAMKDRGSSSSTEQKRDASGNRVIEYDANGYAVDGDEGEGATFNFDVEHDAKLDDTKRKFMSPFIKFIRFGLLGSKHVEMLQDSRIFAHEEIKRFQKYFESRDPTDPLSQHRPRTRPFAALKLRSAGTGQLANLLQNPQVRTFLYSLLPKSYAAGATMNQKYMTAANSSPKFNELIRKDTCPLVLIATTDGYVIGTLVTEGYDSREPPHKYLFALHNPQGGMAVWKSRPCAEINLTYNQDSYYFGNIIRVVSPSANKISLTITPEAANTVLEVAGNPCNLARLTGRKSCQIACVGLFEITSH